MRMRWRPETKIFTCRRWQLSPPTTGLTCDDHRQPGWRVARAKVRPPIVTRSIFAFAVFLSHPGTRSWFPAGVASALPRVGAGAVPLGDNNRLIADHTQAR
jgi:hypothetical protein